jgi:hypothetical protein
MELDTAPFELKAGLPGTVTNLLESRGAEIATTGALVQGAWGNGKIDFGLLSVLARSPQDVLTADRLDVSQRGSIVLGGIVKDAEVLNAAAEIPLRGLILSSLDSTLVPAALKMKLPLLVVEGFGRIPMNPAAFKLLSTSERRETAINAEPADRFTGARPEVVIPLPASGEAPLPAETGLFREGQKVRAAGMMGKGINGVLVYVLPGLAALPNGVRAPAAEIRLESGENVVVPLANLEVLE